jgi:hypothetical protein
MNFLVYFKKGRGFSDQVSDSASEYGLCSMETVEVETLILTFSYSWFQLVLKQLVCYMSLDVNSCLFSELWKRRMCGSMLCVRLLKNFVRGSHHLSLEQSVLVLWMCRNLRPISRWMVYRNACPAVPVLVS